MKTTAITGCGRKCPCRLWVNCGYYTDMVEQTQRLQSKESMTKIVQWYESYFKVDFAQGEFPANG